MTRGTAAWGRPAILVVEDSATEAEQLSLGLEACGYAVAAARDGAEGLARARALRPDLVISDVVMPRMDGYEMCRAIKRDADLAGTPVILVTALSSPADVLRGLECGADNFVRKPYDLEYLAGRITSLLANRHLRALDRPDAAGAEAGLELDFDGQRHVITSARRQILDLLISTYEQAVRVDGELRAKERELRRSYDAIDSLYRHAAALNAIGTEAGVLDATLEHALQLPQVMGGWVWLADGRGRFQCAATRSLPADAQPAAWTDDCECQRRVVAGDLRRAANISECRRFAPGTGGRDVSTHVSVPLRLADRIVGIVNLLVDAPLQPDALAILDGMVMQAGVALVRVRLQGELQASNAELQWFVHSVSHDLRTPLGILSGFAAVLDEHQDGMDEQALRSVAQIRKYSAKMNQLFEDLLAFSRTGRAEIKARTVDLGTVVAKVREELAPTCRERQVAWSIGPLPVVQGDAALLGVVFDNLLSNAIKFTRPRARAEIEIGATAGGGGEVVVFVRDNGVGFDPSSAERMFGVFERLHPETEFEGTGIGLATVRRIVSRHGGRVWATGEVNRGATVYLTLVQAHAEPSPPTAGSVRA